MPRVSDRDSGIFRRLADALADDRRSGRTAAMLIAAYTLLWWLYAVVAKSSQDIHFDMGEVVAWANELAYGYPKHPPFPAWVAAAWFAVFPRTDWAFYLLSMTSVGVALWFVWLIAVRFVGGGKRTLALAMLTFSPAFNLQPLKFNSNALLIPVWAIAAYAFVRSFAERNVLWGAIAGACAAMAVLTKYWSGFLILGFIAAALAHPQRWNYLRSPAPWSAILVGALLLAPNIASFVGYHFAPLQYAIAAHKQADTISVLVNVSRYAGGLLLIAPALVAVALACRPNMIAARDVFLPSDPDRTLLAIATYLPLLAPVPVALTLGTGLSSLWTTPMWSMLPALLLSSNRLTVAERAPERVLAVACAVPVVALLLSPAVALAIHHRGADNHSAHYRQVAQALQQAWRAVTDKPLRIVGSYDSLLYGSAFYLSGKAATFDLISPSFTPWVDDARISREGIAVACPADEAWCVAAMNARVASLANAKRSEVELARTFLGVMGRADRFLIAIIPPAPN